MSPATINASAAASTPLPAMTPLPVSGAPAFFMSPFQNMYNPGSAPCAAGWGPIPTGNTYSGYCETTAVLTQQAAMFYGAAALAALFLLPGWSKALAIIPAYFALGASAQHI